MSGKWDNLPTWEELVAATSWLRAGCPVLSRHCDPERSLRTLLRLADNLPQHLPHYAYGTEEWKAELARLRQEAKDQEDAIGDGSEGAPIIDRTDIP